MLCAPCVAVAAAAPPLAVPMVLAAVAFAIAKMGLSVIPKYLVPFVLLYFIVRFTR